LQTKANYVLSFCVDHNIAGPPHQSYITFSITISVIRPGPHPLFLFLDPRLEWGKFSYEIETCCLSTFCGFDSGSRAVGIFVFCVCNFKCTSQLSPVWLSSVWFGLFWFTQPIPKTHVAVTSRLCLLKTYQGYGQYLDWGHGELRM